MTSLSVSQFWNLGLMQAASVTGEVGVSFIVTLFALVVNYIWEEGICKETLKITASTEKFNLLLEDKSILARYNSSDEEKMFYAKLEHQGTS